MPPIMDLIEALNHVDGQSRISAKEAHEDEFYPCVVCEDTSLGKIQGYEEEFGHPTYTYNDIYG